MLSLLDELGLFLDIVCDAQNLSSSKALSEGGRWTNTYTPTFRKLDWNSETLIYSKHAIFVIFRINLNDFFVVFIIVPLWVLAHLSFYDNMCCL
jgi:hypothetical protein